MANTYKIIGTTTVGSGGSNTIEFTSIPQTYTDLLLYISVRSNRSLSTVESFQIRPNGSMSGSIQRRIQGSGSSAGGESATNEIYIGQLANNATSNTFNNVIAYFPNYTDSNGKTINIESVTLQNNTTDWRNELIAVYTGSTSAITSITISCVSFNFVQYSTAYLYGISNA